MAEPSPDRPRRPVIGILGGMGPEATVDLLRRVVLATPAKDDSDHVHVIADNNPGVPSRIKFLLEGGSESPLPELVRMARNLQRAGATVLAMPCNTAHAFREEIATAAGLPFLDMVALSADRIAALGPSGPVGILASTAVLNLGLYERALAARGLKMLVPRRQDDLMDVIRGVKAGATGRPARDRFEAIANELVPAGAERLLIACTELSVLAPGMEFSAPAVDALDVLAQEIVAVGLAEAERRQPG